MDNATHNVSNTLKWISRGPSLDVIKYSGYLISGIQFSTMDRNNMRTTQNSGVRIMAKTMHFSSAKNKNSIESDMIYNEIIK